MYLSVFILYKHMVRERKREGEMERGIEIKKQSTW